MPPVFGPVSPSPTRLWSCAAPSGSAVLPSHSANSETSSPTRHSSITTEAPASPNARASIIASIAASASSSVAATTTALPAARPSAFTTTGAPRRRTNARAAISIVEAFPLRGGDAGGVAQLLGEGLAAFELRGGARRADAGDRCRLHRIGDAGDQRGLGAGNHEVDLVVLREGDQGGEIQHADRHAFGHLRDAGIAWRAPQLGQQRAGGDRPAERVLASTGSDDQNAHPRLLASGRGCSTGSATSARPEASADDETAEQPLRSDRQGHWRRQPCSP